MQITIHGGLTHLQAAEFLYETSLFPERQYTFKHALTHEVAYGSLLQEQRRVLHGQILHAVEVMLGDRYMEQVESLAHHALRGEVWDKALLYFRQAGEKAMTHSASREAVICFEQALTALPHLPAQRSLHELAIDLRISLYTARITLGKIERAFDDLHEAETLAEALNDAQRLGRVSYHMAQYLGTQGAYDRARAVGQRALALGTASEDVGTQVSAHFIIGAHAYFLGDYVRTVETLQNAIELVQGDHLYERFGRAIGPAVSGRTFLVACLAEVGDFAQGMAVGKEMIEIAETLKHPLSLMFAYMA